ncbi:MAG TPA: SpoIIE family protein phosphatase [Pyrinomonadaceae bacterium]|nr:SpoIIE family protein phosphatase [Pyrinomonadaceae bacterium]
MRVFPRIRNRRLGAKGGRRTHRPRGRAATRGRTGPHLLLLIVPPLLFVAGALSFARASPAVLFALTVAAALYAAAQSVALRRVSRRTPLQLSLQEGEDRRFLLDLSGGVRAATSVVQLYEQVAAKIAREFRVDCVTLFIRDDATGDFVCRAAHGIRVRKEEPFTQTLRLGGGDFVVRRLRHLASPLAVDPRSFDLWVQASPPAARASRAREAAVLRLLDARLLVQVNARERLTGVLALGPRTAGLPYTADEKLLLLTVAGQLALVVENSKLLERMVEEERLRRELLMAAEVQRRLFPESPPASDSVELAGYCQPARKIGGDYYDFFDFGGGQTGLVVADVAGKGISAALLVSTLHAALHARIADGRPGASHERELSELVSTLNRLLCQSTGPASYVTFFYAQFDARTGSLGYINAGHNPPLLVRRDGETDEKLDLGGPVLGIFEGLRFEQGTVPLRPGDVLVGYTDGVVEALDARGEEFGERRLRDCVASLSGLTAEEICERVVRRLDEWCDGTPQHDDLTLVVLKVK